MIEPDQGGETVRDWLSRSAIRERAYLVSLKHFKDPSVLYLDKPDDFRLRFECFLMDATPWTTLEDKVKKATVDEAWADCRDLAHSRDILTDFYGALSSSGVAGEERAAKLIYLALVSRFLDRPISIAVKGASSGGKSFLCEQVLKFFPDSAFYSLTAMSERALAYSDESLTHRFLVLFEAAGFSGDMQTYLIRSLLSEGRIRYEVVEKTSEGMKPRLIEREGPTGLLVTTTAAALHPENETRLLSLTVTDTPEQTRAVLQELANTRSDINARNKVDLRPWQSLQIWLGGAEHLVVIPFAKKLALLIPPVAVRLRRDFSMLLSLIASHAILHQATRKRSPDGRILATLGDYEVISDLVRDSMGECLEATVSKTVRDTVNAVKDLCASGKVSVTAKELADILRIDRSAALRRANVAGKKGFLQNLEDKKGRPARLVLGDPLPKDMDILPPVARLHAVANGTATTEAVENIANSVSCESGCTVARDPEGVKPHLYIDQGADDSRAILSGCTAALGKYPEDTDRTASQNINSPIIEVAI